MITEKRLHQGYRFFYHKILKAFTNFYYRYKDLVYKYSSTYRDLIKKELSSQCLDDDVINKANKFKSDTSKLITYLTNLIRQCYYSTTIIVSLRQTKNINNLLVQLVDYAYNEAKIFIFHSILYYHFIFNILFKLMTYIFWSPLSQLMTYIFWFPTRQLMPYIHLSPTSQLMTYIF